MAMTAVFTNFGGMTIKENRGGTKRGYVPDPLGSTKALVDSSGAIQDAWEYWPYGEVESHTGTSTTQFTFVGTLGYFRDLVSKLTYIRARYYQAFIGQWMTKDQLWPSKKSYTYGHALPLQETDRSGLSAGPPTCNDCPPPLCHWFIKLCNMVRTIDQSKLDKINDCIRKNSNFKCPIVVAGRMGCMQKYCSSGTIANCVGYLGDDTAGETDWCGNISIVVGAYDSNRYKGSFREMPTHYKGDVWDYRDMGLIFLHELGHACGYEHGIDPQTGKDLPKDWQCNDVFAFCTYGYIWDRWK